MDELSQKTKRRNEVVIAIIIAGGIGARVKQQIPKQFINVYDKPIIIYTLEQFQKHPEINNIVVVCLEGWHDVLNAYAKQYGIAKLLKIVVGGNSGQESIKNGIDCLNDICSSKDIVIVHDSIRPMVSEDIISDCILKCKVFGNGVSSLPITEQIFWVKNEESTNRYIPREQVKIVQTPQAYQYGNLKAAYEKAFKEEIGIKDSAYTNTMMADLGEELYFSKGSSKNIKITTKDDIEIFKAMVKHNRI